MCVSPPTMKAKIEMKLRTFDDLADDIKELIAAGAAEPFESEGGDTIAIYPVGYAGQRAGKPITLAAVEQHLKRVAPSRMAAWN